MGDPLHGEILAGENGILLSRQISDVTVAGQNEVIITKESLDLFGFSWRFYYEELLVKFGVGWRWRGGRRGGGEGGWGRKKAARRRESIGAVWEKRSCFPTGEPSEVGVVAVYELYVWMMREMG